MPLIVFEGVDGGGKTSQMRAVSQLLKHSGWNVSSGAFPTSTFRHWQNLLFANDSPTTTQLVCLHFLDFIQHAPTLSSQNHVFLLDRYYPSTAVYQSTPEVSSATILQMADALKLPSPDLYILFLPPNDDILPRLKPEDIHLLQSGRWHQMRDQYLQIAATDPVRWIVIDTSPPFEKITRQVATTIQDYLLSQGLRPTLPPLHSPVQSQPHTLSKTNTPPRIFIPGR